jgi:hypothetical protein
MRTTLLFEAAFAPRADALARVDAEAAARGWTIEMLSDVARRYARGGAPDKLALQLESTDGWAVFRLNVARSAAMAHGWSSVEDLLVAWCQGLDVLLGRSVGEDGFPRLEPWELVGNVDALDALQWFGRPVLARLRYDVRQLDASRRPASDGGAWLKLVDDPFEDPSEAADRARILLRLTFRSRPASVTDSIEATRAGRARRAPVRTDSGEDCLLVVRTQLGSASLGGIQQMIAAAETAGVRERVGRHLRSCLDRYGADALSLGLRVIAGAAPALLAAQPEDVVEAVVRAFAWRSRRSLVETAVVLERWLERADDAPVILTTILEAHNPDAVGGMVTLDLATVRACPCDRCADRRKRLDASV